MAFRRGTRPPTALPAPNQQSAPAEVRCAVRARQRVSWRHPIRLVILSLVWLLATWSGRGFTLYNSHLENFDGVDPAPPQADFDMAPALYGDLSDCINHPNDHWAWPANQGAVVITYFFDPSFDLMFPGPNGPATEAAIKAQIVLAMQQWSLAAYSQYGWFYYGTNDSYSRANPLILNLPYTQAIAPFMDVRSAAAHELGHILGFGHCDQGAVAQPQPLNFAYIYNGSRGYGPRFGSLQTYTIGAPLHNYYLDLLYGGEAMSGYADAGIAGQEVMSQYSAAGPVSGMKFGRQPGEIYHTLSWDELDGYAFIYGSDSLQFQPAPDEASANLVINASGVNPLTSQPFDAATVCEGIPYGLPNNPSDLTQGILITNAIITFNTNSAIPIGYESAGFNLDIQGPANGPSITGVTLNLAGTENTTLVGPTFDNFVVPGLNTKQSYVFQPGVATYLGSPEDFPPPNDSTKDTIGVTWSGSAADIPAGTLLHVGVTPDVWDWTDYPLTANLNNSDGSSTPVPATPVHVWSSAEFYGYAAASAPSGRISASCLTTIAATNTVGVRGLAVTSPMNSTKVYNLKLADVTGMGLSLSNLNRGRLAQLQQSNLVITVTNFGTHTLNSNEQFVVILQGSASYLPAEIATNGHYLYLNQSNLVNRELFASVTSSNAGVVVNNYTLLNPPPTTATTAAIGSCLSIQYPTNITVTTCSESALVYFPAPSFTDPCCDTNSIQYEFMYPSPKGFTLGKNNREVITAHDDCGNYATVEFTVWVLPGTNCPPVSCTNACIQFFGQEQNLVYSSCSCVPVFYTLQAVDTCCTNGPVTLTFDPTNGACFMPGTTNVVHCTATSACGYCNTTNFTVTVLCTNNTCGCNGSNGLEVVAQSFSIIYNFTNGSDGASPTAGLVLSNNTLYGTASAGGADGDGTVFSVRTGGTDFTTLHSFPSSPNDGADPSAGLTLSGTNLYGTSWEGGTNGTGTVFAVNTDGSGFAVLHTFSAANNNINSDGTHPYAGLVLSSNTLYGTANVGGTNGFGTVFALNTDGTGFRVLYNFTGSTNDGADPESTLVLSSNTLYGTTLGAASVGGGAPDAGTVFAVNTDGTGFRLLHGFTYAGGQAPSTPNSDGASPHDGLILSGSTLYGTAQSGGANGYGTVFAVQTDGTGFKNLHSFTGGSDGADPFGGVILSGNTLYGATYNGGSSFGTTWSNGWGTVFAVNTDSSGFTTLHTFVGSPNDGANPWCAALVKSGNTIYGTTTGGGSWGWGTVFALTVTNVTTNCLQVVCPSDIVTTSCTNVQEFYAPTVTDLGCTNWTVVCTPPSGSYFAPGTVTTVNCAVMDCCGNSKNCYFTVTVLSCSNTTSGCQVFISGMGGAYGGVQLAAGTADPNFILLSEPAGAGTTAVVSSPLAPNWIPEVGNVPDDYSQWISPEEDSANSPAGRYHYQLQFYAGCANSQLVGRMAADDQAVLYLNGQPAGTVNGWTNWTPVNLTSGFVAGNNILDIYVTNVASWSGLRAELTNCYSCSSSSCTNGCIYFYGQPKNSVYYSCSCVPVFYTLMANDACCTNGPVTLTFDPPNGTCFMPGTTNLVYCTATSACGYCNTTNLTVTVLAATNNNCGLTNFSETYENGQTYLIGIPYNNDAGNSCAIWFDVFSGHHDFDQLTFANCPTNLPDSWNPGIDDPNEYTTYTIDSSFPTGFADADDSYAVPAPTLSPGQGVILIPAQTETFTFTGTSPCYSLTNLITCPCGTLSLVSYPSTCPAGLSNGATPVYEEVTGQVPQQGVEVITWNGRSYNTYTYTGGAWAPSEPTLPIGEGFFILVPCATNNCLSIQSSNLVVTTCSNCATVVFTNTLVSDTCCSNVNLFYSVPTNTCFEVNTTNTIEVVAVDACDNVASNIFTLTVIQNTNCPQTNSSCGCNGSHGLEVVAQSFGIIYNFTNGNDGAYPHDGLILSSNTLYGTTARFFSGTYNYSPNYEYSTPGTVFSINLNGTDFTPLYDFTPDSAADGNSDGAGPNAGLVLSNGIVYGTAAQGGTNGAGTIFKLNSGGTGFTTLHDFGAYSINSSGRVINSEGVNPYDTLVLSGTNLYGTAAGGGTNGFGTVFAINTDGTGFRVLYSFFGSPDDGGQPLGGLVLSGNTLYGTTAGNAANGSGSQDAGTVFAINTDGTGFRLLHSFTYDYGQVPNSDGSEPIAGLLLSGKILYGTTFRGGTGGYGTVFAVQTNGTDFTILYNFSGRSDGGNPAGGLALSGNTLYGTTYDGGSSFASTNYYGWGTVFAININGSGFTTLHTFASSPSDGANPWDGVLLSGNTLYGTTIIGGTANYGTVFGLTMTNITTNCLQVACPSDIVTTACTNVQEFYAPMVTDLGCTNWTVVCTPPSGSYFEPGTVTTVNCMVMDCCGNSSTCSFTVTVFAENCCSNCFTYANFGSNVLSASPLDLNGDAAAPVTGLEGTPVLRLTPADNDKHGSAFVPVHLGANLSFSTAFAFQMSNGGGSSNDGNEPPEPAGADGIVFVLAAVPTDLGLVGQGVGYEGIPSSVGIKFDTWQDSAANGYPQDSDPNGNFVAVYTDGNIQSANYVPYSPFNPSTEHQYYTPPTYMKNGDIWYAWIDYNGATGELDVYLSDGVNSRPATPQLIQTISLNNLSNLGFAPQVYAGFTSGTGGQYDDNDILSWEFCSPCTNACISVGCSNIVVATCTNCALVSLTATVTDTCCTNTGYLFFFDGGYHQGGTNNPTFCFPVNTTTTVEVLAYDICGNSVSNYFTVTVVPGNCSAPCTNGCIKFFSPTELVYSSCTCVQVFYPMTAIDTCCTNGPVTLTFNPPNGTCFSPGTYSVSCTGTSACGYCNTTNFTVVVNPSTNLPVINCPSNIVVSADCQNTQVYYDITASSAYCSNVTVVATPPSGSYFAPGTTPVNCVATDCCGNSNYCSFTVTVNQAPSCIPGQSWVMQPGYGPTYGQINSMACSADGRIIAVAQYESLNVAVSTNYGVTWTLNSAAPGTVNQYGDPSCTIACSSDGSKMFFANGGVYTSTNYGTTWSEVFAPIIYGAGNYWSSIACSADGRKVIVDSTYKYSGSLGPGEIAISSDYGMTWVRVLPQNYYWGPVASSADGSKLVVAVQGATQAYQFFTSTDSGATWQNQNGVPNSENYVALASSSDGSKLIAAANFWTGPNYQSFPGEVIISANYGTNWNAANLPATNWSAVASSADGSTLLAAAAYGQIYISSNYGSTWTPANVPGYEWAAVASSADASKLVAGASYVGTNQVGVIYTSACTNAPCCVPPPTNMVLWLPFDETSGSTSANLASPADPGTQFNHPTPWLGAYVANSLVFNGSNYVVVPDYPGIELRTNGLTIDAWIYDMGDAFVSPYATGIVTNSVVLDKLANSPSGYSLWMVPTNYAGDYPFGSLRLNLPGYTFVDTHSIGTFGWHFIAVSMNQFANPPEGFFYVDGALTSTFTPPPVSLFNTNSLWLAAQPVFHPALNITNAAGPYAGALDEVEIYSRGLSTNELNAIYDAGTAGKCKPCNCRTGLTFFGKVGPNTVELIWGGCGVLLEATNVNGPWTPIPNPASPLIIPATQPKMFYQLQCP